MNKVLMLIFLLTFSAFSSNNNDDPLFQKRLWRGQTYNMVLEKKDGVLKISSTGSHVESVRFFSGKKTTYISLPNLGCEGAEMRNYFL